MDGSGRLDGLWTAFRGVRWPKRLLAGLAGLFAAVLLLDLVFPPPLTRANVNSVLVTDRMGKPLRAFAAPDGRWRFAVSIEDLDPAFVDALVRVEDKRLWNCLLYTTARAHQIRGGDLCVCPLYYNQMQETVSTK